MPRLLRLLDVNSEGSIGRALKIDCGTDSFPLSDSDSESSGDDRSPFHWEDHPLVLSDEEDHCPRSPEPGSPQHNRQADRIVGSYLLDGLSVDTTVGCSLMEELEPETSFSWLRTRQLSLRARGRGLILPYEVEDQHDRFDPQVQDDQYNQYAAYDQYNQYVAYDQYNQYAAYDHYNQRRELFQITEEYDGITDDSETDGSEDTLIHSMEEETTGQRDIQPACISFEGLKLDPSYSVQNTSVVGF